MTAGPAGSWESAFHPTAHNGKDFFNRSFNLLLPITEDIEQENWRKNFSQTSEHTHFLDSLPQAHLNVSRSSSDYVFTSFFDTVINLRMDLDSTIKATVLLYKVFHRLMGTVLAPSALIVFFSLSSALFST